MANRLKPLSGGTLGQLRNIIATRNSVTDIIEAFSDEGFLPDIPQSGNTSKSIAENCLASVDWTNIETADKGMRIVERLLWSRRPPSGTTYKDWDLVCAALQIDGYTLSSLTGTISRNPIPPDPDILPVTKANLRNAVTEALYPISAHRLADVCVKLGLPAQKDDEEPPMSSKRQYIERRLEFKSLAELTAIAEQVVEEYDDPALRSLLRPVGLRGVDGKLKNIIFAADGPKPRIILRDALDNTIEIIENADKCLVYDKPLAPSGLTWQELVNWWATSPEGASAGGDSARSLYERLKSSLSNNAEILIFQTYYKKYASSNTFPALIPQVYLHYDPYTLKELGSNAVLGRQRMDFLLLLPENRRVVLELDGVQHYADPSGKASPELYANMVREDRALRLRGYEMYRFGGFEIMSPPDAVTMLNDFFSELIT